MPLDADLEQTYRRHLLDERNLSDNSIRAYLADVESLISHINQLGISEFKELQIGRAHV